MNWCTGYLQEFILRTDPTPSLTATLQASKVAVYVVLLVRVAYANLNRKIVQSDLSCGTIKRKKQSVVLKQITSIESKMIE